ncbi:MAG: WD40 repeat domain-containing protein [Planctomycetes bacterium]|nr:WD40 repeat domain-containing protein [Planctomycetota bacterium]
MRARLVTAVFLMAVDVLLAPAQEPSALPEGAVRLLGSPCGSHPGRIVDIAFAQQGKLVVSLDDGGGLRIWEVPSLAPRSAVDLKTSGVFLSVNADGTLVAVGQGNGVFLFTIPDGKAAGRFYGPSPDLIAGAFSPSGKRFAALGQVRGLNVWDVSTRTFTVGYDKVFQSSPDSGLLWQGEDRIVAWNDDGMAGVYDAADLNRVLEFSMRTRNIDGCTLSPDGKKLAVATHRQGVRCWDLETGKECEALVPDTELVASGIAWSADGKRLAWTNDNDKLCTRLLADPETVLNTRVLSRGRAVFSPQGDWIATRDAASRLTLFAADTLKRSTAIDGHHGNVSGLQFDAAGEMLWSAAADGVVRSWDLATGASREVVHAGGSIIAFDRAEGGSRILTCTNEGKLAVWDGSTGERLRMGLEQFREPWSATSAQGAGKVFLLEFHGHGEIWDAGLSGPVCSFETPHENSPLHLALSDDGRLLAIGPGPEIDVIDTKTGGKRATVTVGPGQVWSVAVSPDLSLVACSEGNARTYMVELASGDAFRVREHDGFIASFVEFAPGNRLVLASERELLTLSLDTFEDLGPKRPLPGVTTSLAVSPDGRFVATGFSDGTIVTWNLPALPAPAGPAPDAAQIWSSLSGDARAACDAIAACASAGPDVVKALAAGLTDALPVPGTVGALVERFASTDESTREDAEKALREIGLVAEPALQAALKNAAIETRPRLQALLATLQLPPLHDPALVRRSRALRALERCGTDEAKAALRSLASNAPYVRERMDAEAAVKRLEGK